MANVHRIGDYQNQNNQNQGAFAGGAQGAAQGRRAPLLGAPRPGAMPFFSIS